jgi:hypothetical protein
MAQNSAQILSKVNLDEKSNKIKKEIKEQKKVILYSASDGKITANVFFAKENFWITQKTMAELFGVVALEDLYFHIYIIFSQKNLNRILI